MLTGDRRLSTASRALLDDRATPRLFSAASVWEAAIKRTTGKLRFPDDLWQNLRRGGFVSLDITTTHAEMAGALPLHHTDPFDRMLVAQAQHEGLSILTADPAFEQYAVHVIRA